MKTKVKTKPRRGRYLSAQDTIDHGACDRSTFLQLSGGRPRVMVTPHLLAAIADDAQYRVSWLVGNMLPPDARVRYNEIIESWKLPKGHEYCCEDCDRMAKMNTKRGLMLWGRYFIKYGAGDAA